MITDHTAAPQTHLKYYEDVRKKRLTKQQQITKEHAEQPWDELWKTRELLFLERTFAPLNVAQRTENVSQAITLCWRKQR